MNTIANPLTMLSETKFFDAYSRMDHTLGRYETWKEAVARVMRMHREFYADKMNPVLDKLMTFIEEQYGIQHILGAQRALQFGGPQLLKHHMKMYNCTSTWADRTAFFGEVEYMLLCGAGVGFSVQRQHVAKLPAVAPRGEKTSIFVVPDSIEGWAEAFDVLLSSYWTEDATHPTYRGQRVSFDLSQIRPKGALIADTFRAPGPQPLKTALERVESLMESTVSRGSRQLRPIEVYDIVMHMADAVISGGVRRSATLCMFSLDDIEMMHAKTGNWFETNPQRGRSNNSVVLVRDTVTREDFHSIIESTRHFGEPGFIFTSNADFTYNPCVEIGMLPVTLDGRSGVQGCNLTEVNGSIKTEAEFYLACEAAALLGTLQAGYTDFRYLDKASKEIFEGEALIGVSITGWMNNPELLFDEQVMRRGARIVKKANRRMAKLIGINPAARTTCVKPSGNASVLLGTASGIHGDHAPHYFRHVELKLSSEVTQLLARTNPSLVQPNRRSTDPDDVIAAFPISTPKGAKTKKDLFGVDHLEYVKKVQQAWVEEGTDVSLCRDPMLRHNVSNTIQVDDWDEVADYLFDNRQWFAGVSLISNFGDKDFVQSPFTEVRDDDGMAATYGEGYTFLVPQAERVIAETEAAFDHLWQACATVLGHGLETKDWDPNDERVQQRLAAMDAITVFADYGNFDDTRQATYFLKDVYNRRLWDTINEQLTAIDWTNHLRQEREVDANTLAGAACSGGLCELSWA